MEVNSLISKDSNNRAKINELLGKVVRVHLIGVGSAKDDKKGNTAHFIVSESEELDDVRSDLGLKNQDFHITIGFNSKDVFGKSKGLDSIFIKF
jgi:hypothetical protein